VDYQAMKIYYMLLMSGLFSGCIKAENWEWKQESGFSIGDFIDFNAGYYKIDEDDYVYIKNRKAAKVVELTFEIAGNHKMIIESLPGKKKGIYTVIGRSNN
jgi:hypothetical protein